MKFNELESAGYLANHMARLFAQGLQDRIKEYGLAPGQFPTLLALWNKEGLTQKELVQQTDVEQATIANTLTRMERDGLIKRKRHPADGRAQQIWLTEKAKLLKEPAINAAQAQNKIALQNLSEEEVKLFLKMMRSVIATLRETDEL